MNNKNKDKIKLYYRFDSRWTVKSEYFKYDGDEFCFPIDIDEAKNAIMENYVDIINVNRSNIEDFIKLIEELDGEELISWEKIFESNKDVLEEYFEHEAMEWFMENHHVETKEDYRSNEADMVNDDSNIWG